MNHPNIEKKKSCKIVEERHFHKKTSKRIPTDDASSKRACERYVCCNSNYFSSDLVKEEKKIGSVCVVTAIELKGKGKKR